MTLLDRPVAPNASTEGYRRLRRGGLAEKNFDLGRPPREPDPHLGDDSVWFHGFDVPADACDSTTASLGRVGDGHVKNELVVQLCHCSPSIVRGVDGTLGGPLAKVQGSMRTRLWAS